MHLRSRLHERAALAQAKVIAYFFDGRWGNFGLFTKALCFYSGGHFYWST